MLYSYSFYLELILNFNNIEDKKQLYKETKHRTYIITYITNEERLNMHRSIYIYIYIQQVILLLNKYLTINMHIIIYIQNYFYTILFI